MKHTFIFIDKLILALKYVPSLHEDSNKTFEIQQANLNKLKKALKLIDEYSDIIKRLVLNHRVNKHLSKLHSINGSDDDWVKKVNQTLDQIEDLLRELKKDVLKINKFLKSERIDFKKLQSLVADAAFGMYISGLHDDEDHLIKLRKIAIFEMDELKKIINHEQHHEGLIYWLGLESLSSEERLIREENFFIKLFS